MTGTTVSTPTRVWNAGPAPASVLTTQSLGKKQINNFTQGGDTMTVKNQHEGMLRRNFLKLGGAGLVSLPFVAKTKLASGALLPGSNRKKLLERSRGGEILCTKNGIYRRNGLEYYLGAGR